MPIDLHLHQHKSLKEDKLKLNKKRKMEETLKKQFSEGYLPPETRDALMQACRAAS